MQVSNNETAAPVAPSLNVSAKDKIARIISLQRAGFYVYAVDQAGHALAGDSETGTRSEKWTKRTWRLFPDAIPQIVTTRFGDAESLVVVDLWPPSGVSVDEVIRSSDLPETFRIADGGDHRLVYRVPMGTPLCEIEISSTARTDGGLSPSLACDDAMGEVAELPDALFGRMVRTELAAIAAWKAESATVGAVA